MIEYIKGPLDSLSPTCAVIECAGVGYLLEISLTTFESLQPAVATREVTKLLVHEVIREDAHMLYGFASSAERQLFRLLIGVSGVGANIARTILSALAPSALEQAIAGNDVATIKTIKGIGTKTAERIIVDLRDKIKSGDSALSIGAPAATGVFEEALAALTMLGFQRAPAEKVLRKILGAKADTGVEAAIKQALAML